MVWPSVVFIRSARIRAMASDGPPAENGTTMVSGCDGKLSARALPPKASNAANAARTILRIAPSPQKRHAAGRELEPGVVDRLMAIQRARDRRQRVFEPGRAIEQHHAIIFGHAAIGKALLVGGVGCRPLRTQQQA